MSELDDNIRAKFEHMSTDALIRRIEKAEDFGYDDEGVELDRRMKLGGQAWKWTQINGVDRIEVYPDVTRLTEADLIIIMTEPGADEALLSAAEDEYFRRRAEVINRAQEDRQ